MQLDYEAKAANQLRPERFGSPPQIDFSGAPRGLPHRFIQGTPIGLVYDPEDPAFVRRAGDINELDADPAGIMSPAKIFFGAAAASVCLSAFSAPAFAHYFETWSPRGSRRPWRPNSAR